MLTNKPALAFFKTPPLHLFATSDRNKKKLEKSAACS